MKFGPKSKQAMAADKVPHISVVMPVYNGEKYLEKCILSMLNQTFSDFEFIIVNDGSKDGTASILEKFAEKDKRIRVFHQKNQGIVKSLNMGCKIACGKYIARMDADDISLPNRLQIQYATLEKGICTKLCHSLVDIIDINGDLKPFRRNVGSRLNPLQTRWMLLWCNCVRHPTVMMRRDFFLTHGLKYSRQANGCEDYELWCRLSNVSYFVLIKEALVRYRVQPDSITHKSGEMHLNNLSNILSNNLVPYLGRALDGVQRRELAILSGQTHLGKNYRSYNVGAEFFTGLIENVNKRFLKLHQLDNKETQEVWTASAKLCMRWSKATLFSRTDMALRFMIKAMQYAIRGNMK